MMRASVILLLILGAAIHESSAASSFKDVLQRAKDEMKEIASSLKDKERMQAKLQGMRKDLAELYKLTLEEAQRAAGPYIESGQQSLSHFRKRVQPYTSRAELWLQEQSKRAMALHLSAVETVQGHVTRLPQAEAVERKHIEIGLFVAYSGVVSLLVALLLRRAF